MHTNKSSSDCQHIFPINEYFVAQGSHNKNKNVFMDCSYRMFRKDKESEQCNEELSLNVW